MKSLVFFMRFSAVWHIYGLQVHNQGESLLDNTGHGLCNSYLRRETKTIPLECKPIV
jgi:hypothetical protein